MSDYLSIDFLIEVLKTALTSDIFMEVTSKNLEYHYMPTSEFKEVWREMSIYYDATNERITIGMLSEKFKENTDVLSLIGKIKKCDVTDSKNSIIKELEKFIQTAKFKHLFESVSDTYNEGKREKAIDELIVGSDDIREFSLVSKSMPTVFSDFEKRQERRIDQSLEVKKEDITKVPFGIHPVDYYTRGGLDVGRSALVMAISGGGKSTFLRWVGICAARIGLRVVHFQCEGTEQEALDAYDAAWTSVDLSEIEFGHIPKSKSNIIKQVNQDIIDKGGEIYVVASEELDSMYIEDCPQIISDLERDKGKVHLAIFDYLEIFNHKGNFAGQFGERQRREKIANKITNIAVKFKLGSLAATQANDIKKELKDDPDFVLTRNDLSEFKGALKPFSYFFTVNQTYDEYRSGIVRIHNDKLRKYRSGQTYRIAQSLENSRFYDNKRTLNMFWDEMNNKPM